jgi:hypothetical protein
VRPLLLALVLARPLPTSVTRDAPKASPPESCCVTSSDARGSPRRFWVCIAIVLIRKIGRPFSSSAYGMIDPKGNRSCLSECVERLPMRPKCKRVRARSAKEGSGRGGWLLGDSACFLAIDEDILVIV